jgi:hypothetical protein
MRRMGTFIAIVSPNCENIVLGYSLYYFIGSLAGYVGGFLCHL